MSKRLQMSTAWSPQSSAAPTEGPSYRLAFEDVEFLGKQDLRPLRLQLELLKPEWYLRQEEITSTIVVFGSARLLSPEIASKQLAELKTALRRKPKNKALQSALRRAEKQLDYSRYYAEARRLSALVLAAFPAGGARRDFVVVTGGGPGIMEAANRGAHDVNGRSIGFNITLPREQVPNSFVSPNLCFRFRYFAIRKMHFLLRARAWVVFPGGFGTMDELFEVLTLIRTGKIARMPVVLIGRDFWSRAIDFNFLVEEGVIDQDDITLFQIADCSEQAIQIV